MVYHRLEELQKKTEEPLEARKKFLTWYMELKKEAFKVL